MIKQISKVFLLVSILVILSGCTTPEHNIKLHEGFWQNSKHKVTVVKTKSPKPGLRTTGQGLIDMAISAAATKQFNSHLERTNLGWYNNDLPQKFIAQLKQRNISAEIYSMDIEPKQKKSPGFVAQLSNDKLLLIELEDVGATRSYYGFIPTSAPKAYCVLKGELMDQDKKVLWRHAVKVEEPVKGEWDQPPNYPNFSSALNEAFASAQEEMVDGFFSGH